MAYRAKENILQYKQGDIVEEIQDNWKPYFDEVVATVEPVKVEEPKEEIIAEKVVEPKKKKGKKK